MKKILIIDDNEDNLQTTAEILELSNYKVITASGGKAGLEQAIKNEPDLILCDIMMPELDGYAVLHMVRKIAELEQTPFIFVTAKTEPSEIRKGMSLGADDFITKPFDATDLLNTIETRLKKTELVKKRIILGIERENNTVSFSRGEDILRRFVEERNVNYYKKRQRIFSENNHSLCLYYLQKGSVKIFKTSDGGKELILKILNEGEFFGYVALLEETFYKEYADALEDCEIVAILKNEFYEIMHSYPKVAQIFMKLLAMEVSQVEEQLIHIAYNSLRKKVADALLLLKEKFKDHKDEFSIRLSRENIAAVAGTATESLIRTLGDFKAEKLIDIRDSKIAILNEDKIRKLTN
jgi:CRP-like cAMP-binding protein/CheY-like chemotaxis protein